MTWTVVAHFSIRLYYVSAATFFFADGAVYKLLTRNLHYTADLHLKLIYQYL